MTYKEFADEFFRVIEEGQFTEEAMDFVDELSRRNPPKVKSDCEITANGIKLIREYKRFYKGEPLTAKEIATKMGLESARHIVGVINNLVKNGFLEKGNVEGIKMNTYDLTEKAKNFNTERVFNSKENEE